MKNEAKTATTFRLTSEHRDGGVKTLASSKKPANLLKRIAQDGDVWSRNGFDGVILEDDASGSFRPTKREDLRTRLRRNEITWSDFRELRGYAVD